MANVDEALLSATVISADPTLDYAIDDDLRVISIPSRGVVLGVEGDKDVNRVRFSMVKTYKGTDLSSFSCRVCYVNANGEAGYYDVDDLSPDGSNLEFTWLVSDAAVRYKGTVLFAVALREIDGTTVKRAFNTTVGTATSLEGLASPTSRPSEDYSDLVALIEKSINTDLVTPTSVGTVLKAGENVTIDHGTATISANIPGALIWLGTKRSTSELPNGANYGDVWHVASDGCEYAWDGSSWQCLGNNAACWLDLDEEGYLCAWYTW